MIDLESIIIIVFTGIGSFCFGTVFGMYSLKKIIIKKGLARSK